LRSRKCYPYLSIWRVILCWDVERNVLLLLRDTVLGDESTTSPNLRLWLRRCTGRLTDIVSDNLGVDVTEEEKRGWWP
jgi:hypothetical protein